MKEWGSVGLCIIMALSCACISQSYEIAWTKTIPQEKTTGVYEIVPGTHGVVLAGFIAEDIKLRDVWVVKVNMEGDTLWSHRFGYRLSDDCVRSIAAAHEGYVLTGYSIDTSLLTSTASILVIKISETGSEEWIRTYSFDDSYAEGCVIFPVKEGYNIMGNMQQVKDSSLNSMSDMPEQTELAPSSVDEGMKSRVSTIQGFFMRIDSRGEMICKRVYDPNTTITSALPTSQGYLLMGGKGEDAYSDRTLWVQHIDQNGEIMWSLSYEKPFTLSGESIIDVGDGYILGVNVNHDLENDFGLMKIDKQGNELWFQVYDRNYDFLRGVACVKNGFILVGTTSEIDLSTSNIWQFFGQNDVLIIRTDSQGKEIWRKIVGTEEDDEVITTLCLIDNSVMMAGNIDAGDLHNIYLIKLA